MSRRLTVIFDGQTIIDREVYDVESEEDACGELTLNAQFDPIPMDHPGLTGQAV